MYTLPPEGIEDNNPIVLRDVNEVDFRGFLRCALKNFSEDEGNDVWLSAIKVADLWHLTEVRNFAVSKLEKKETDLAVRIELSLKHGIREWFVPNMLGLAMRTEAPIRREAEQLGWENAIRLFQLREMFLPLRLEMVEMSLTSASTLDSTAYTCPLCQSKIMYWQWKKVDDNAEAQNAWRAILDAFPDAFPPESSLPWSIHPPAPTYTRPNHTYDDADCCIVI